jgi:hypothetical protein
LALISAAYERGYVELPARPTTTVRTARTGSGATSLREQAVRTPKSAKLIGTEKNLAGKEAIISIFRWRLVLGLQRHCAKHY